MLDSFIKFLDWLSAFLKNRKNNEVKVSGGKSSIAYSILTSIILILIIFGVYESSLAHNYGNSQFIEIALYQFIICILIFPIIIYGLHKVYKKEGNKHFFISFFPILVGILSIVLYKEFTKYTIFLNSLLIISPLIFIIQSNFSFFQKSFLDKTKNFFFLYNLGFFFFSSINVFLITIGFRKIFVDSFLMRMVNESSALNNSFNSYNFWQYILSGIFIILIISILYLTFIYSLNLKFELVGGKRKSLHKATLIFFVIYLLGFTGNALNTFYDYQINKANSIISENGENASSYEKAKVFFLERAFLSKIKNGEYINNLLFSKIYDSTPEQYFGDKIADYSNKFNSFETNSSKVGDKANVLLGLGEIESKVKTIQHLPNKNTGKKEVIKEDVISYSGSFISSGALINSEKKSKIKDIEDNTGSLSVLETTYRFNFQNKTNTNQEVVLFFEAPSINSVVSSLKMGLDLENVGIISPRGSARQVYENSLIRNIDPALIEKVGLNTYSLRVFPIPPSNNEKNQGRQLVEFKILSPLGKDEKSFIYSPKVSFINIKTDENSSFISKVYNKDELIKEDIIKNDKLKDYLNSNHNANISDLKLENTNSITDYCPENIVDILTIGGDKTNNKELKNKTVLFFDNSASAKRNGADKYYDKIFSMFKNYNGKLNDVDLYSYNFDVNKIAEISDIKFWGYSNIDRTIDYIINNNIKNENIVFITDDDSFNYSDLENKTRNLEGLVSNKISVIKIGKNIKTYKQDFNNILSATSGNIYEINSNDEINNIINKITDKNTTSIKKDCLAVNFEEDEVKKIYAGILGNLLLSNIKNSNDWLQIANIQTALSVKYGIVNQFNSLIVLENQSQLDELNRYNQQNNKYDTKYKNYGGNIPSGAVNFISKDKTILSDDFIRSDSVSNTNNFGVQKSSPSFGAQKMDGTAGGNVLGSPAYDYDYGNNYSFSTNVSIIGFIIMIIYLLQFGLIFEFIKKYLKDGDETRKISVLKMIVSIVIAMLGLYILIGSLSLLRII